MARQKKEGDADLKAWVFKDPKQVAKHGDRKAAWCVGWYTPAGKRRHRSMGTGSIGRQEAWSLAAEIHKQLLAGTYDEWERQNDLGRGKGGKTWAAFCENFRTLELPNMRERHAYNCEAVLKVFERHCPIELVSQITPELIAEFKAKRRQDRGARVGTCLSLATLKQNLAYLHIILSKAHEWGYLASVPKMKTEKLPRRIKEYVPPEEFSRMYQACHVATRPDEITGVTTKEWWQALLVMAYMTGWRIGQILALRWEDVDLVDGSVLSRADDNKGKRDVLLRLPDEVIRHICTVRSGHVVVFPWFNNRRGLYEQFEKIQKAAKVSRRDGTAYGFHDLRRGFATMNEDRLTHRQLTVMMQHRDTKTTDLYVDMARQHKQAAAKVFVPQLDPMEGQSKPEPSNISPNGGFLEGS